jgi:single-stranded DNA-binding protein
MSIECAITGRLSADAEVKLGKTGRAYLRMRVRVGEGDAAQWIGITCFDEATISNAGTFSKGAAVYIEGRLSLGTWTGQDGVLRHGLSVVASHCRLAQIGRNRPWQDRPALEHA